MSEQEKNTGSSAAGGSVVMVEQTTGSHHKTPYRPNELQEGSDVHHKRSTAPAVPSVAEQLKDVPEDSTENDSVGLKEQKECEPAMSTEKQKHIITKKISSSAKRREHSLESIPLTPIETDIKKGLVVHPSQPIPTEVQPALSATLDVVAAEKETAKKGDDDSITEEITEMRIPEVAKEHSEWGSNTYDVIKKNISWSDKKYLCNVILQDIESRSQAWILDRKASVGPCYRPGLPFEGPSGITICVPKKSVKNMQQSSGININVSRKSLVSKSRTNMQYKDRKTEHNEDGTEPDKMDDVTFLGFFKAKVSNIHTKLKNAFNV